MEDQPNNEFKLGRAIGQSRMTMPDAGFEQMVMAGIALEAEKRHNRRYVLYSMVCMAGFLIAGIVAILTLDVWLPILTSASPQIAKLMFEVVFVFCVLMQGDRLMRYWNRYSVLTNS